MPSIQGRYLRQYSLCMYFIKFTQLGLHTFVVLILFLQEECEEIALLCVKLGTEFLFSVGLRTKKPLR